MEQTWRQKHKHHAGINHLKLELYEDFQWNPDTLNYLSRVPDLSVLSQHLVRKLLFLMYWMNPPCGRMTIMQSNFPQAVNHMHRTR